MSFEIKDYYHDLLIIGAGGAGLSAAIFAALDKNYDVGIVTKSSVLDSNTNYAQGGINASLGNVTEDNWQWHSYDTIKSSAWIADQDSVEEMCQRAPEMISFLTQLNVGFNLNSQGKIDQKTYGGQSTYFGHGELAHRVCYIKDKTGKTIMSRLYAEALKHKIKFYNYNYVTELLVDQDKCYGAVCFDTRSGVLRVIKAGNVIIASGGCSQIYATNTSSSLSTGDGNGLACRANIALQDMEFVQFHPTSLSNTGRLITEAARSAGGFLLNNKGERFMKKYAPKFMELAPRDVVSRAIATEIINGLGCGLSGKYINLDLTHLSTKMIKNNLPTLYKTCKNLLSLDPGKELISIAPSAHYTMGGIPTDNNCNVVRLTVNSERKIEGLYAIGETACISVHGANRLGCNSLLDLLVFAKKTIEVMQSFNNKQYLLSKNSLLKRFNNIFKGEVIDFVEKKTHLQGVMNRYVGVLRTDKTLKIALKEVVKMQEEFNKVGILYSCKINCKELESYYELYNMINSSIAVIRAALWRKESRGAHWRDDYNQEDNKYLGHTIVPVNIKEPIFLRSVRKSNQNVDFYQPKTRNY